MERAKEFNCPREAQRARPMLDPSCAIPLTDFAGLVASYGFPKLDWQRCQLEKNGSICRQLHGDGWIAKRNDGKEGFIGKDCAYGHFGADSNLFKSEAARIKRELRIDGLVARISAHQRTADLSGRISALLAAGLELRDEVRDCRDQWPKELLARLLDMARTLRRDVVLSFRYIDEDDDGKKITKSYPVTLGAVAAPSALTLARFRAVSDRLHEAQKVLHEAVPHKDQPEKVLKKWIAALDEVDTCAADLQTARTELKTFLDHGNLKLLCWCLRQDHLQNEIAKTALTIIGGKKVTLRQATEARSAWAREIRAANHDRDFSVVAY